MLGHKTDRKYRRLTRAELLELLIEESEKNEKLKAQLKTAQDALSDRSIKLTKAGSLAEAALLVSGVFEAAEAACNIYRENIEKNYSYEDVNIAAGDEKMETGE